MLDLAGRVALVAGATRGAGRGIARGLGERGATVYCTGRTSRSGPVRAAGAPFDLDHRPETIEETAALVTAAGGEGIAMRADHSRAEDVDAVMARIRQNHGQLDILVNDIWGGDAWVQWDTPIGELDIDRGRQLIDRAVFTHVITARAALPLLRRGSVVIELTDGDSLYYRHNLFYDLAKVAVIRLSFALSEELRPAGIASIAVTPGFLRSEAMLDHFGVHEDDWKDGVAKDPHFLHSESPLYVGRGVAALVADPAVLDRSGTVVASWTLARRYGVRDADGTQPDFGRHAMEATFGRSQQASHDRFVFGTGGYPLGAPER